MTLLVNVAIFWTLASIPLGVAVGCLIRWGMSDEASPRKTPRVN